MPAIHTLLTTTLGWKGKPITPTDAAYCDDGHEYVELYRGFSRSAALQKVAVHNASVHGISRFGGSASIHMRLEES